MRLHTAQLAAVVSMLLARPSLAEIRPPGAEAPFVAAGDSPRSHRDVAWAAPARLASATPAGWTTMWDRDTDVPLRMWGAGIAVPGANADPAIAEAAARQYLADHLGLLAPGATTADFELVSNQLGGNGEVRSLGFVQRASGLRVLGGSIAIAFKRDRLVMVSSTALPNVAVTIPARRRERAEVERAAQRWLAADGYTVTARVGARAAPSGSITRPGAARQRLLGSALEIVPIVRPRRGAALDITYRVAESIALEATTGPGRWDAWIDASDGTPILRRTTISYGSGKVLFDVPDRGPLGARHPQPALATHDVNGVATTAAPDGTVTWGGTAPASVALRLTGPLVAIKNVASGGVAFSETLQLASGGSLVWSHARDEKIDAQLDAFVFVNQAKAFAKARLDPRLGFLDQVLQVFVNEFDFCNAFSTGDDIHFFQKNAKCENTARLADVVYHEFGHSLHHHAIIEGVGQFDGAMSEGLSDLLSSAITGDHRLGRGFFLDDRPLRDLDPVGIEKRWPDDAGEVHDAGEIIGGTMWDLRKALEAKLGQQAGFDRWLDIYYGIMQRASDTPSSYAEAILADDDDGDLSNGTPNLCAIDASFGAHGLADPTVELGISGPPVRDGYLVSIQVKRIGATACPGRSIASAVIDWNPRGATGGQVALVASGDSYTGEIPAQADGTLVQYKVTFTLSDGTTASLPHNPADPYYELYVGPVTPLWCADFEAGASDWTTGGTPSNLNKWQVGAPVGLAGDPKAAFGGANVFGIDLTTNGSYWPRRSSYAETPEIDLAGNTAVRLQYRRWLTVEDGFFDQATILANGEQVWSNHASTSEPNPATEVNHTDREWRFQDLDLSAQAAAGTLKVRFDLKSDPGLELGGWTLDDVCVVAPVTVEAEDAGCCSASARPDAALGLGVVTLGIVLRRRRRRAR